MSSFKCKCGNVMKETTMTEEHLMTLVPEKKINYIGSNIKKVDGDIGDFFYDQIDVESYVTMLCPNCRRIWLSDTKGRIAGKFICYAIENE